MAAPKRMIPRRFKTTMRYKPAGRDHDEYMDRLWQFCLDHNWELHYNQSRLCVRLLDNPRHRCQLGYEDDRRGAEAGFNIDHGVVLIRRDANRKINQWAILSQPYSHEDKTGRAINLGLAPYGSGTFALLYEGAVRT